MQKILTPCSFICISDGVKGNSDASIVQIESVTMIITSQEVLSPKLFFFSFFSFFFFFYLKGFL